MTRAGAQPRDRSTTTARPRAVFSSFWFRTLMSSMRSCNDISRKTAGTPLGAVGRGLAAGALSVR